MPDMAANVSSRRATSFRALFAFDDLGQTPRIKARAWNGWRRSWLAAARKRDFGDIGLFCFPLGGLQRCRRVFAFGDISKRDDDALHSIILGAVGQDPADIPETVPRLDFPLDRLECLQHCASVD